MAHLSIQLEMIQPVVAGGGMLPAAGVAAPIQLAAGVQFHARPGDLLRGNLVLHTAANKELKLNSKGIELIFHSIATSTVVTRDSNGKNSHQHTARGGGEQFRQVCPVVAPRNEHVFGPNQVFAFPFQFTVPLGSAASQQMSFDYEGRSPEDDHYCCASRQMAHTASISVGYEIKATAFVAGLFTSNLPAQNAIIVDPVLQQFPIPETLVPATVASRVTVPTVCCCDMFGFRPITGELTVPKVGLTPGEALQLLVKLNNATDHCVIDSMTIAVQQQYQIHVNSGRLRVALRRVTAWRQVEQTRVNPNSQLTLTPNFVFQGLMPHVQTSAFSCVNVLLVRLHIQGFKKHLELRIPLASPYLAPPGSPAAIAVVSSALGGFMPLNNGNNAPLPGPPPAQSMGGGHVNPHQVSPQQPMQMQMQPQPMQQPMQPMQQPMQQNLMQPGAMYTPQQQQQQQPMSPYQPPQFGQQQSPQPYQPQHTGQQPSPSSPQQPNFHSSPPPAYASAPPPPQASAPGGPPQLSYAPPVVQGGFGATAQVHAGGGGYAAPTYK